MDKNINVKSEIKSFSGVQGVYSHYSETCNCEMTFGLYLPEISKFSKVPTIWYLSGLTCTHENAMLKAGIQFWANQKGLAVIFPDTSPRGATVPDNDAFDLGQGAGFYVNATQSPWSQNYQMWDYVVTELPSLISANFSLDLSRQSIMGHSMGGHGALTMAFDSETEFLSVSAFSPICSPSTTEWGIKQLTHYLGDDQEKWKKHDASLALRDTKFSGPILIDVGTKDEFWDLLSPTSFIDAATNNRKEISFRLQKGYDHSYFFVSSFIPDHVNFHAKTLLSR